MLSDLRFSRFRNTRKAQIESARAGYSKSPISSMSPWSFSSKGRRASVLGAEPNAKSPPSFVSDFLATYEGLSLIKAFVRIKEAKLRCRIVNLVEEIARKSEL